MDGETEPGFSRGLLPAGEGSKRSAERKEGAHFGSTYTKIVGEEGGRDGEIPGMAYII